MRSSSSLNCRRPRAARSAGSRSVSGKRLVVPNTPDAVVLSLLPEGRSRRTECTWRRAKQRTERCWRSETELRRRAAEAADPEEARRKNQPKRSAEVAAAAAVEAAARAERRIDLERRTAAALAAEQTAPRGAGTESAGLGWSRRGRRPSGPTPSQRKAHSWTILTEQATKACGCLLGRRHSPIPTRRSPPRGQRKH